MYTVRNEVEADYPGTLRKVAEMGYKAVQAGPNAKHNTQQVRKMMDDLGLVSAGMHMGIDMLEKDFNKAVDMAKEIGTPFCIVSWMPEERRKDAAGWIRTAKVMTELGAKVKAAGLQLRYHNHSFEFHPFGGKCGYEIFFENVDPELVGNEIDTYWVRHGNEDPVAHLKKYAGRIQTVHFKDMGRGPDRPMVPVGTGILDWPKIIAACKKGGAQFAAVEQDTCDPLSPLEAARISLENLRKLGLKN
jgi:sugar phosphate isomerase/epimerase